MNLFTEHSEQHNVFNYNWKLTNGFPQSINKKGII